MNILIDTHFLIWSLYSPDKLSRQALDIFNNEENVFYYSLVSLWEIEIKHLKNSDLMPYCAEKAGRAADLNGLNCVPITRAHIGRLSDLQLPENAPNHSDPFDRMLLCQALADNYTFLTHDSKLALYNLPCVLYV